jgi:N-acetylglucosaminyldiphosphoundecaprenol N-acetyl-beta-D-mannosaminyltransferase
MNNIVSKSGAGARKVTDPGRVDVLGSRISAVNAKETLALIRERLRDGRGGYICFTNVHTAVGGRQDPKLLAVTNNSFLSVADGKPVYWLARSRGAVGHVPGPDFMALALDQCRGARHFFYGSTAQVLERLAIQLRADYPGLNICGFFSPPFRELTTEEKHQHYRMISLARPDFIWVGLGAPKQELWMAEAFESLRPSVLLGVGAAFDFHAQVVSRAPGAMRAMGLEWLFRLMSQPRRLWRRYLVTNSLFLLYLAREAISGVRRRDAAPPGRH